MMLCCNISNGISVYDCVNIMPEVAYKCDMKYGAESDLKSRFRAAVHEYYNNRMAYPVTDRSDIRLRYKENEITLWEAAMHIPMGCFSSSGISVQRGWCEHKTMEVNGMLPVYEVFPAASSNDRNALKLEMEEKFPTGTRVSLVYMCDKQSPPTWTKGTVTHIDDSPSVHVRWDNGSTLALIPGTDRWNKLLPVKKEEYEKLECEHPSYCGRSIEDPNVRCCFAGLLDKSVHGTTLWFEGRHFELV